MIRRLASRFANSIRLKVVTTLLILSGLVIGVSLTGTFLVRGIEQLFTDVTIASESIDMLDEAVDGMRLGRMQILLASQHEPAQEISKLHDHGVDVHIGRIEESRGATIKALQALAAKLPTSPEVKELTAAFDEIWTMGYAPAIDFLKTGNFQKAAALATPTLVPAYGRYESLATSVRAKLKVWVDISREDADDKAHKTLTILAVVSFVILIISALYYFFGVRPTLARLGRLQHLAECSSRGALDLEKNIGRHDEIGIVFAAFNVMIISYKTIIGKLLFESKVLGDGAQQLLTTSHRMAVESKKQADEVRAVAAAVEQLNASMASVNDKTQATLDIASVAEKRAGTGKEIGTAAAANMESVGSAVIGASSAMKQLTERSHAISSITASIKEIADQTNLLALNAAIEAARAGEQGRGFAVVADEVRKLAEKSATAAAEITAMLAGMLSDVEKSGSAIEAATHTAKNSAEMAREMSGTLGQIQQGAAETSQNVNDVATAVSEQTQATNTISRLANTIYEISELSEVRAHEIENGVQYIGTVADGFNEIKCMFDIEKFTVDAMRLHDMMHALAMKMAAQVSERIEAAIQSGKLSEADVMDQNYQPIPNTDPQKFRTRYDEYFDTMLSELQENSLAAAKEIVYAIAIDRNGYVPTHNKRFSKPLTGDRSFDLANNRTKRKFTDPVGLASGKSQLEYLLQTYRRDTGEIMHDMSAPIRVRGVHWGGFRIGYLPPA